MTRGLVVILVLALVGCAAPQAIDATAVVLPSEPYGTDVNEVGPIWSEYFGAANLLVKNPDAVIVARQHFEHAAQMGLGAAYGTLAALILEGRVTSSNKECEALVLLLKGAEQPPYLNCIECLEQAGTLLFKMRSYDAAAATWRDAAQMGNSVAMHHLADAIEAGTLPSDAPADWVARWRMLAQLTLHPKEALSQALNYPALAWVRQKHAEIESIHWTKRVYKTAGLTQDALTSCAAAGSD